MNKYVSINPSGNIFDFGGLINGQNKDPSILWNPLHYFFSVHKHLFLVLYAEK